MRLGMALGADGRASVGTLTRSYAKLVAGLDDRARILLVAERDGELVGMAQLVCSGIGNAPHRAEVQRVAVADAVRRTGVGRELMVAVEATAAQRGITLLWLTTHDETDACRFYESIGYTKLGVMPSYSRRPDGTLWPGAFYFRELGT
jgi:GNAT superfamily N-acetyltransferase